MTVAAISSKTELIREANAAFPATGTIGYLVLLSGDLIIGDTVTVNATTDTILTPTPHQLTTGSRVRLFSTIDLPSPLANRDYWVITTGASTFQLAESLVDAQNGIEIDLDDAGTGILTLAEQVLSVDDPIEVLINKELVAGAYQRQEIEGLGGASIVGDRAEKAPKNFVILNTGATDLVYRHVLIAYGAGSTVGTTAGITGWHLASEPVDQITVPDQQREITLLLGAKPA